MAERRPPKRDREEAAKLIDGEIALLAKRQAWQIPERLLTDARYVAWCEREKLAAVRKTERLRRVRAWLVEVGNA